MRHLMTSVALISVLPLLAWSPVRAQGHEQKELEGTLVQLDLGILAEQYRDLRMETFKLRKELMLQEIVLRRGLADDRSRAKLEAVEEQMHRLEAWADEIRSEMRGLQERRRAQADADADAESDRDFPLAGRWLGRSPGNDAVVVMVLEEDHFMIRAPGDSQYYQGTLEWEREGDRFRLALELQETSDARYRGEIAHALAELDDRRLRLAINEPGHPRRPQSFEPGEGTKVVVFERE